MILAAASLIGFAYLRVMHSAASALRLRSRLSAVEPAAGAVGAWANGAVGASWGTVVAQVAMLSALVRWIGKGRLRAGPPAADE